MLKHIIKKYPNLLFYLLSHSNPKSLEKKGEKKAIELFNRVKDTVPAYKRHLEENNFYQNVKSIEDFKKIPIIDKKTYIKKYSFNELQENGEISNKYSIDRSSGYSGKASYWPRKKNEDKQVPFYLELVARRYWEIDKKKSLAILTMGLGSWVGGEKVSWSIREIAIRNNFPFSTITPGLRIDETLEIIKDLKDSYQQIILIGYPPVIKMIIDQGKNEGIDWKKINLKIALGGEGFSEEWREYINQEIGLDQNDLINTTGFFAAADLGLNIGREYPITTLIRKLANKDKKLANALFKDSEIIPFLCQYNPTNTIIEEINSELIFTVDSGIPLIRYNIHDKGGIISFDEMINTLKEFNYDVEDILLNKYHFKNIDIWHLPFFFCFGRNSAISFYGIILYPEYIKKALENKNIREITTHNFIFKINHDEEQNPILEIHIELIPQAKKDSELQEKFLKYVTKGLINQSSEYKELHSKMRDLVKPKIILYNYKESIFKKDSVKYHYQTANES